MKCSNCGNIINNSNNKLCTYCGTKIDHNEQIINSEQKNENLVINNPNTTTNIPNTDQNNTTIFLIIGIIMALICSMPFGIGIILLNELKYKKELNNNKIDAAEKTKNIMIILIVIGILSNIILRFLSTLLSLMRV